MRVAASPPPHTHARARARAHTHTHTRRAPVPDMYTLRALHARVNPIVRHDVCPCAVLLFHLTNHYALIYGAREWTAADGTMVRQVLTTRRGQRPTTWMDFDEVRDVVIKWSGYKVIQIERETSY